MARKILILCDSKSFMLNALVSELSTKGYEFNIKDLTLRSLMDMEEENLLPKTCLVYLKELDDFTIAALKYLSDLYDSHHIKIILLGSKNDLEDAFFIIPKNKIARAFVRPINVIDLEHELDKIYEAQAEDSKTKKILIIDDDVSMLRSMRNLLSQRYQTFILSSGKDAITFLKNIPVNLILLDYEMPEMSGPEVFAILKENALTKSIPVMFLTAKQDSESVKTAVAFKPEKYLLKSLPPDTILSTIDAFLNK
ncbi:response regulator [Lachnobacterium bovis]|uniref:Stage 0 sporulation protein A homolog n=1 Tax=Lachnobacterium bovis TaxID=140626 RepID=A0A1H9R2M8_9FIRM|nr:response regulator [Lachnobacterium bovis]SER66984.1 Response regulator receiver domain-containing protein [Lachnobacterium bovis]